MVSANVVVNSGVIEAQAIYGVATAVSFSSVWGVFENTGEVLAYSDTGAAVRADGMQTLDNRGFVSAVGGVDATGIVVRFSDMVNDGHVEAVTFGPDARASIVSR